MIAVPDFNSLRACGLAVLLAAGLGSAASTSARADVTGFTPSGSQAEAGAEKPGKQSSRGAVTSSSKGWRYKYCDYVWVSPRNGVMRVAIENRDGSTLWYDGDANSANIYQDMMMRACSRSGAYYGIRFTDINKGKWDAIAAY
jgi:hypothetical protein